MPDSIKIKKAKASDHDSYGTYTLISILLPVVGVILGIVYLAKDKQIDKKFGEHLLSISVLALILWGGALWYFSDQNTSTVVTTPYVASPVTVPTPVSNWDINAAYEKVQNGMNKAQVETATGKPSTDCTESESMGQTAEACSYGGVSEGGIIVVQYSNGQVVSKAKQDY